MNIHDLNIAFITEGQYFGEIPLTHTNLRTDLAWQYLLKSTHIPINVISDVKNMDTSHVIFTKQWDILIIILPKSSTFEMLANLRETLVRLKGHNVKKIAIMQEGPNWYWQDYPVETQIAYLNLMRSPELVDIILCHNECDGVYYSGMVDGKIPVRVMPPQIVEQATPLSTLPKSKRLGIIIGGNMVSWYGGADSYLAACDLGERLWCVSMGRRKANEELYDVRHIPYKNFSEWMEILGQFKLGIHLMRTRAAGTFFLNCAYLGIPAIGYKGTTVVDNLYPQLKVDVGHIKHARSLVKQLLIDEVFYDECVDVASHAYNAHYSNRRYIEYMGGFFSQIGL